LVAFEQSCRRDVAELIAGDHAELDLRDGFSERDTHYVSGRRPPPEAAAAEADSSISDTIFRASTLDGFSELHTLTILAGPSRRKPEPRRAGATSTVSAPHPLRISPAARFFGNG
jgi:hypothetical protein